MKRMSMKPTIEAKPPDTVCVSGYGASGSSPLVALLRECDGYGYMPVEFRLIKDPYGILALESALVDNWDVLPSDNAIKDFLWIAEQLDRTPSRFSLGGMQYGRLLDQQFMQLTREYIQNLVNYEYEGHWFFFNFKTTWPTYMWRKLKKKLGIGFKPQTMYFSKPSREEFIAATTAYLGALFDRLRARTGARTVILNQAVPVFKPTRALDYLANTRLIIVDRDPRDSYVDMINRKLLIGRDLAQDTDASKFIMWHRSLHDAAHEFEDSRILRIRFEDLALQYEATVKRVLEFLHEDESIHRHKKQHLDPSAAATKIGLWKEHANQNAIDQIYHDLREYCY